MTTTNTSVRKGRRATKRNEVYAPLLHDSGDICIRWIWLIRSSQNLQREMSKTYSIPSIDNSNGITIY